MNTLKVMETIGRLYFSSESTVNFYIVVILLMSLWNKSYSQLSKLLVRDGDVVLRRHSHIRKI